MRKKTKWMAYGLRVNSYHLTITGYVMDLNHLPKGAVRLPHLDFKEKINGTKNGGKDEK